MQADTPPRNAWSQLPLGDYEIANIGRIDLGSTSPEQPGSIGAFTTPVT